MSKGSKTAAGKQRWRCHRREGAGIRRVCYQTTDPTAERPHTHTPGEIEGKPIQFRPELPKGCTTFIVTAAQNATPVHAATWKTLLRAAKHFKAALLVQPLTYRNPTSMWSKSDEDNQWWAPEVVPYLCNVRMDLNKNLEFLADIPVIPTASEPLTGLEGFGAKSKIVGHTKLSLRTVATQSDKMAQLMTTTGACTKSNYTQSRAGKMGEFHHSLAAVIVEIEGPYFWLRHLNFNSRGECTDLGSRFTPKGVKKAPRPAGVVFGDVHVDSIDPDVQNATFGAGGLVETLRPKNVVYNDLLDGYAANPHHNGNPFNAVAKRKSGADNVEAETRRAIKWVKNFTPPWARGWIVDSNHDRFLNRYISSTDWRSDPTNAEFYLKTALAMVQRTSLGIGGTEYPDPFRYWVESYKIPNVKCAGESLKIAGIECGMHGDRGPNGARGSIRNLRRIGTKSVIGHSHSPGINEGCYQTGTSTRLRLEYNAGPSSWMQTHCIIHADGKRQLITIINKRWRR